MTSSITYLIEHENYSRNYCFISVLRDGTFYFRLKLHETTIYNLIKFFYNFRITLHLDFDLKIYDKCIDDRIKEYNNL